ncbi:MAG TPA: phosphoribosyltransferase family protein [Candidatus Cybelea sp.]
MTALDPSIGVGRRICGAEAIAAAVERLATQIAADYRGQPLVLLGVLKGALCLTADLARALTRRADGPSEILVDYLFVQRYGASGTSGGGARLEADASLPLGGTNLLILDGIVDEGLTLEYLRALLKERRPATLRTCVLFDNPARRKAHVPIEYLGLAIPDAFVIGYGLDYKEWYRNLPYLAELREDQPV